MFKLRHEKISTLIIGTVLLCALLLIASQVTKMQNFRQRAAELKTVESENGTLGGPAVTGTDTAASGGKYVVFNQPSVSAYGPKNEPCTGSPLVIINPGDNIQAKIDANPSSGVTFCFKAGTHRLTTMLKGRSGHRYVGEFNAIVSGAQDISTLFVQEGTRFVASNMTMESPPKPELTITVPEACLPAGPLCRYNEDVYLNDVLLKRVGSVSEVTPGKFFFDYANNKIYIGDNPSGKKVEVAVANKFMQGAQSGLINVTIKNLIIEKFATPFQEGALDARDQWTAENNEVRFNHGVGVLNATTIRGNYIHHNGEMGIGGGAGLVENNEIAYNNTAGFNWGNEGGGTKWVRTDGMIVRNNYSHHNTGPGLWTDGNNINTIYENNRVEYNRGPGIFDEINFGAIIRNNTVKFNNLDSINQPLHQGGNIHINTAQSTEIYGNTVETAAGTNGITMYGTTTRGISGFGQFTGRAFEMKNISVHDNTVKQNGGRTGAVHAQYDVATLNIHFTNNTYYLDNLTAQRFDWNGAKTKEQWKQAGNDTTGSFLQL